jgi:membrane protein
MVAAEPGRRAFKLLKHCAQRFRQDQLAEVAGSLAFTSVLATVPLIGVVFGVFAQLPAFSAWMNAARDFLLANLMPDMGNTIGAHLQTLAANTGRLTAVGIAFLVLSALALMATIEQSFNRLWRATRPRGLLQRLAAYWALLTLAPLLLGAGLAITDWLGTQRLFGLALPPALFTLIPLLFEISAFALLYGVAPNVTTRPYHALAGALLAAFLFEIAKRGFALYIKTFASYELLYGALAALPVFMLWVYVSWLVILLGAALAATLHQRTSAADAV